MGVVNTSEACGVLCHNPSLGLATKARVCKRLDQETDPGVWESVRMNSHTPK
jgi:hypothetical protein